MFPNWERNQLVNRSAKNACSSPDSKRSTKIIHFSLTRATFFFGDGFNKAPIFDAPPVICRRLQSNWLQSTFNCLIDSFIASKVGLAEDFLQISLAAQLKQNLITLYSARQLVPAGIGNKALPVQDHLIRSDKIYWLDRAHGDPHENSFFDLMDRFVLFLNSTCYTGITGYEFHYALYEKGSFYKKHIDQFRSDKGRAFSMIMYLNTEWQEGDGGELCIYHSDSVQTIAPRNGQCVFFESSRMEHEVLITHQPRLSITGWLKR